MSRFYDGLTEVVFQTGFAPSVPKHVAHDAHWVMQVLICATSLEDVSILGPISRWVATGRLGLHVDGKWTVTFTWDALIGAKEIRLERH